MYKIVNKDDDIYQVNIVWNEILISNIQKNLGFHMINATFLGWAS